MPRIEAMYAIVAEDTPGNEGLAAFFSPQAGGWMPLVRADAEGADSMRPIAQLLADQTGRRFQLLRFSVREEMERIEPRPQG